MKEKCIEILWYPNTVERDIYIDIIYKSAHLND